MSVSIDVENFPRWSDIFKEIERQKKSNDVTAADPAMTKINNKQAMRTTSIDIENFSSWSEILKEVEKEDKSNEFTSTDPEIANIKSKQERRTRSFSVREPEKSKRYRMGRLVSEGGAIDQKRSAKALTRQISLPCFSSTIDAVKVQRDSRLTDAGKKLTPDKLALLYEDILKPLDFSSMLHERRKQSQEIESLSN